MLFFTSLLHVLWRKESPYRWGKGQQKLQRILLQSLARTGLPPHRRRAGSKGIPHPTPTTWSRLTEHRDKFKKDPDHKTVSQRGGSQLLRSDLQSGPTTIQPTLTGDSQGQAKKSAQGGRLHYMAVTWLETITPPGSAQGNRPCGLNLNRASGSMGEGRGPSWSGPRGWLGPWTLFKALRALTLLSYLYLPSLLLSVCVLFMQTQPNLETACLETTIVL